jgi:hypothetical protein
MKSETTLNSWLCVCIRRVFPLVLLLSAPGCRLGPSQTKDALTMTDIPQIPLISEELEIHFRALLDPFGDEPHRRRHDASVQYLVAHADRAYPLLLDALRKNPTALNAPAIIEILPLFKRSESVPVLEEIMNTGIELVSGAAGIALGRHPGTDVRDALLRGLHSSFPETIMAAIDGLMLRGDSSACDSITEFLRSDNIYIREHALQAAVRLGCIREGEASRWQKGKP